MQSQPVAAWRIALMAKAPVPGLAKTRLAPALGAEGAAALAERLLRHAAAQAAGAAPGRVTMVSSGRMTAVSSTKQQSGWSASAEEGSARSATPYADHTSGNE